MTIQPTEQPPDTTENARQEAVAIESGELEQRAVRQQAARYELYRDNIKYAVIGALWLAVGLFFAAVAALAWHWLAPASWHWLAAGQVEKIETIVFTGAAASGIKFFASKHV